MVCGGKVEEKEAHVYLGRSGVGGDCAGRLEGGTTGRAPAAATTHILGGLGIAGTAVASALKG